MPNPSGWTGVQLDFEALNSTDRAGLTAFTTEMHALMAEHHYLSMAVMAGRSEQEHLDAGYDLPKLSRQLATITLMAYDQHAPGLDRRQRRRRPGGIRPGSARLGRRS